MDTICWSTSQTDSQTDTSHTVYNVAMRRINSAVQRQTAVTVYLKSKQLLLFFFARIHPGSMPPGQYLSVTYTNDRCKLYQYVIVPNWGLRIWLKCPSFLI